jgi:hypothetical protein
MRYAKLAIPAIILLGLGIGAFCAVWGLTENGWVSTGIALMSICVLIWLDASIGAYRSDTRERITRARRRDAR